MSHQAAVSSQVVDADTQVVKLAGEFDVQTTPQFETAVEDALDAERDVVVDLRSVSFLDGRMLRALVRARDLVSRRGRSFALVRPHPLVWRIFVLTGLDRSLPTVTSLPAAVESRDEPGVATTARAW